MENGLPTSGATGSIAPIALGATQAQSGSSLTDPATRSSTPSSTAPSSQQSSSAAAASTAGAPVAATSQPAVPQSAAAHTSSHVSTPPPVAGQALPLSLATDSAVQVITVVASSMSSTVAVLQLWDRAPSGGWLPHGPAVTAHLGSAGLTSHASESLSATPIGSFSLTQAFGRDANPGTGLPYHVTSPADWWISQPGALYNTMQTCSGSCGFTQGDPNEHLYYETPYYNYAVVINYNVSPVVQGAGSAFFLHVTDGRATAGCVAVPQANLVSIMQWLSPSAQPRILIGVS
jgi:L,D-peptidoglycan transpeptidase YkuD (ErfK/YbiS/YcfS/YnhG family)